MIFVVIEPLLLDDVMHVLHVVKLELGNRKIME
jgi:hypothetical protein